LFHCHYVIISSFSILRFVFNCMGMICIVELEKGEDESGKNKLNVKAQLHIYIYIGKLS
jgi:hypothetical protein